MTKTEYEKELEKGCKKYIRPENVSCSKDKLCSECKTKLEGYKKGKQEEREIIKKIIDKKAKENWDCKECGLVNEETKTCKKCGDHYYNSTDNRKLYEIMIELDNGQKEK